MKRVLFAMGLLSLFSITSCDKGGDDPDPKKEDSNSFTDSRDGKKYKTVKIGDQVWMAENLAYEITDSAYCYDNKQDSCDKYGMLYQYKAIDDAIPDGWHLPSDAEWQTLEVHLGMDASVATTDGVRGDIYSKVVDGGSSGLDLENGGLYTSSGDKFEYGGTRGYYWSSTKKDGEGYRFRAIVTGEDGVGRGTVNEFSGCSVRCIKD